MDFKKRQPPPHRQPVIIPETAVSACARGGKNGDSTGGCRTGQDPARYRNGYFGPEIGWFGGKPESLPETRRSR